MGNTGDIGGTGYTGDVDIAMREELDRLKDVRQGTLRDTVDFCGTRERHGEKLVRFKT